MIKLVISVSLFLSVSAFAEANYLENVALKVSSAGNSAVVECIVAESMKAYPEYELFNFSGSAIFASPSPDDQDRFGIIDFIIEHKETQELELTRTALETMDENEKWFYVQGSNSIYPFTRKASLSAMTAIQRPDLPEHEINLEACR